MSEFDTKKGAQAAAVLLKQAPGWRMPYIKLLKLLYVADRESLRQFMRPLVGGRYVAMRNGPLHSEAYELIRGTHPDTSVWGPFVEVCGYDIVLSNDPGDSELSDCEVDLLTRVAQDYHDIDQWDVVKATHDFPEWRKVYPDTEENTSRPIHLHDVLDAVGRGDQKNEILAAIQQEARENQGFRKVLACD